MRRGTPNDDITNHSWANRIARRLKGYMWTWRSRRTLEHEETIGNAVEAAFGVAYIAATDGASLDTLEYFWWPTLECQHNWVKVWFHCQEHGFGPKVPYPAWRTPIVDVPTSLLERLQASNKHEPKEETAETPDESEKTAECATPVTMK